MSRSIRVQRVERELREIVSLFLHHQLSEPVPAFVSVTDVAVSKDLRHATVFFRLSGNEVATSETQAILNDHRPDMQKTVAKALPLKFCPVLRFEYGIAPELDEVDALLWKLKAPRE